MKMKELLILRHGITVWNELKITQGRTNNSLSERGEKEVENTALAFKDKKVDLIYCSPLKRTIQTAEIFNFFHNSPIIFDDRLIEIDQGIFSGRSTKDRNSFTSAHPCFGICGMIINSSSGDT